jgi:hypothetical protein
MRSYTAKIVLLIAVLTSQIVGGSSCCCFSRLLASTLDSALNSAVSRNIPARGYACPKCCKHQAESGEGISTVGVSKLLKRQTSCSGNDRCNCLRNPNFGAPEEKPSVSLLNQHEHNQHEAPLAFRDLRWSLAIHKNVKCSYSPPRCPWPAKRNWQCIACIWIA